MKSVTNQAIAEAAATGQITPPLRTVTCHTPPIYFLVIYACAMEFIPTGRVKYVAAPREGPHSGISCYRLKTDCGALDESWLGRHSASVLGLERQEGADRDCIHTRSLKTIDGFFGPANDRFIFVEAGIQ
jgi:hypothetical protein